MLTADVVLPTPPFWFATVSTRVAAGRGSGAPTNVDRRRTSNAMAVASGVLSSSRSARSPDSLGPSPSTSCGAASDSVPRETSGWGPGSMLSRPSCGLAGVSRETSRRSPTWLDWLDWLDWLGVTDSVGPSGDSLISALAVKPPASAPDESPLSDEDCSLCGARPGQPSRPRPAPAWPQGHPSPRLVRPRRSIPASNHSTDTEPPTHPQARVGDQSDRPPVKRTWPSPTIRPTDRHSRPSGAVLDADVRRGDVVKQSP